VSFEVCYFKFLQSATVAVSTSTLLLISLRHFKCHSWMCFHVVLAYQNILNSCSKITIQPLQCYFCCILCESNYYVAINWILCLLNYNSEKVMKIYRSFWENRGKRFFFGAISPLNGEKAVKKSCRIWEHDYYVPVAR